MGPPGFYVQNDAYYYDGSITYSGSSVAGFLQSSAVAGYLGGVVIPPGLVNLLKIDAAGGARLDILRFLWITPQPVLGGNLALGSAFTAGRALSQINVSAALPGLGLVPLASISDSMTGIADPAVFAMLGWHHGPLHWTFGVSLNIPVGVYDRFRLPSLSLHHWAFDVAAGLTYLDPSRGLEVSVAPGVTFNMANPDTDYTSGTEFHVDFAVLQHLSPQFAVGVGGFHYRQLTADSGAGAFLGAFKGRASGLGPTVSFNFQLGQLPVHTNLRWFKEFDVANRARGQAAFFSISIPLSVTGRPTG